MACQRSNCQDQVAILGERSPNRNPDSPRFASQECRHIRPQGCRPIPDSLNDLAPELLLDIAEYLSAWDVLSLRLTCIHLSALLESTLSKLGIWFHFPSTGDKVLEWASEKGMAYVERGLLNPGDKTSVEYDGEGMGPLHYAAAHGNTHIAQRLLDSGEDADKMSSVKGMTALHIAATPQMALLLILHGADVAAQNAGGQPPLHVACKAGRTEVVRVLLEHGTAVVAMHRDSRGKSALDLAAAAGSVEVVRLFLETGFHVRLWGSEEQTRYPLHIACVRNDAEVVRELLRYWADLAIRMSAWHLAVRWGIKDAAMVLLKHGVEVSGTVKNTLATWGCL